MQPNETNVSKSISIVLVDSLPLRRASVNSLLRDWAASEGVALDTIEAESADELDQLDRSPQLLVYNAGRAASSVTQWRACVEELRELLPDVPLVIISEGDDAQEVVEALKAGAKGFISARTPPAIVFQTLHFILSGGVYFPPSALLQSQAHSSSSDWRKPTAVVNGQDRSHHSGLTERQAAVWRLLQRGHSNKVIARELDMCESTVKVHMRQIMRKLGAANRTQAALCGVETMSQTVEMGASMTAASP